MQAQNRAIKHILEMNRIDLIPDINEIWFTDNINLELFRSISNIVKINETLDEENLKTHIQTNGYKDILKNNLMQRLRYILRMQYMPTTDFIERLENEYKNNRINILQTHLNDKDATLKSKQETLEHIYKTLTDQSEAKNIHNMNESVLQYLDDIKKGIPDRFIAKSIELKHEPLIKIFGNKIFPFVYGIGARPSFRKTDLIINLAVEFERANKYGMIFSFEDVKETFRNKYIAIKNMIPKMDINENKLGKDRLEKIQGNTGDKNSNKVFFYDRPCNVMAFRRIVDQQMKIRQIDYIMADYLQLFIMGKGKRHEEVGIITRECMRIANEYLVPVIFTSQVKERNESSGGEVRLELGDFKESGDIEADVRMAILIEGVRDSDDKTMYIAKNTWGRCYKVVAEFDGPSGYITAWEHYAK